MSYVLGVHNSFTAKSHDSSATLLKNGRVVAAIEEERISRRKSSVGYPASNAIRECLKIAGIEINEVSLVISDGITYPNMVEKLRKFLNSEFGYSPLIELINQATAHSFGSFISSGFQEALVVSVDAVGDKVSTQISHSKKGPTEPSNILNTIHESGEGKSLGYFYSAFTQYLGFESLEGEYKVMGMAAYAEPTVDLNHLLYFDQQVGQIESNLSNYYNPNQTSIAESCVDIESIFKLTKVERRLPRQVFRPEHFQLASSVQNTFTNSYLDLIKYWLNKTQARYLCLSGGCALNALANMSLLDLNLDGIYIMPAASDRGVSMGCAQWGSALIGESPSKPSDMYLGREFTDLQIKNELEQCGIPYEKNSNIFESASQDLEQGKILGWFQGRSEFGPRALGNRSILANPRIKNIKDKLNSKIKFREEFRPFAPAILFESFSHPSKNMADFSSMTITLKIDDKQAQFFPGGVHSDFTSRIQLVQSKENSFGKLLTQVEQLSGHPSLINTSFNLRGEPIVDSPSDAIRTFYSSGIDVLYIGNYRLKK